MSMLTPACLGLVLATLSFAVFLYGAKWWTDLGLRARWYQLWWVPPVYILMCIGLRLIGFHSWAETFSQWRG